MSPLPAMSSLTAADSVSWAALQGLPGGVDPALVPTVTAAAAAAVGAFVAYQAHRGSRRNASRAMLALAVGVLLLTTVPFLAREALVLAGAVGSTGAELTAQSIRIGGLLVVLYALTGGARRDGASRDESSRDGAPDRGLDGGPDRD